MSTIVQFRTAGPGRPLADVATWLADRAEPFDADPAGEALRAELDLAAGTRLDRLVGLLFALALEVGGDVVLEGAGTVSRGALWLRLADEQDRLRLGEALARAEALGKRETIAQALWGVLAAALPGRDVRWDATRRRIVELVEVGEGAMSVEAARAHVADPLEGDIVALPLAEGAPHVIAWRWLSEAHPSLAGG
jgi:hypothetical protein